MAGAGAAGVQAASQLLQGMFQNMAARKRQKREQMMQAKLAEGKAGETASSAQQGALQQLMSLYSRR